MRERVRSWRRESLVAMVVLLLGGTTLSAQTLPVAQAVGEDGASLEFEHAAGMVRGRVPAEWFVGERAAGREVQLALSPTSPSDDGLPESHIWLVVHARSRVADVSRLIRQRLSGLGVQLEATAARGEPVRIGRYAGSMLTAVSRDGREVVHAIVATPWGLVEWHVESPDAAWAHAWFDQIVGSWHIEPPRLPGGGVAEVDAVRDVLGSWKAHRSRMRLGADGSFELIWDRKRLTEAGTFERVLAGSYEADGDLLYVTFGDGSRRNYRWRREGEWLLLTDHEGRIAQLRFFYE